jgi:hypothetical protein
VRGGLRGGFRRPLRALPRRGACAGRARGRAGRPCLLGRARVGGRSRAAAAHRLHRGGRRRADLPAPGDRRCRHAAGRAGDRRLRARGALAHLPRLLRAPRVARPAGDPGRGRPDRHAGRGRDDLPDATDAVARSGRPADGRVAARRTLVDMIQPDTINSSARRRDDGRDDLREHPGGSG